MYVRTMIGQIKPTQRDKMNEVIRIYHDSIVPTAQQQKGFKGAYLLTDSHTGKAVSITLWDTEDDMMESETNEYYQEQIAKIGWALTGPGLVDHYQLSVQTGLPGD